MLFLQNRFPRKIRMETGFCRRGLPIEYQTGSIWKKHLPENEIILWKEL